MRVGRVTWSLRRGIGCTIVLLPCSKARKNFEVIEYLVLCIIVRSLHSRHWTIKLSLSLRFIKVLRAIALIQRCKNPF